MSWPFHRSENENSEGVYEGREGRPEPTPGASPNKGSLPLQQRGAGCGVLGHGPEAQGCGGGAGLCSPYQVSPVPTPTNGRMRSKSLTEHTGSSVIPLCPQLLPGHPHKHGTGGSPQVPPPSKAIAGSGLSSLSPLLPGLSGELPGLLEGTMQMLSPHRR